MAVIAVITADIVYSSKLSANQKRVLISGIKNNLKGRKFEFYRGDSFQAVINEPELAFEILAGLRASAKSISPEFDIRASIGIGVGPLKPKSLRTTDAPAFVISGRAFDALKRQKYTEISSQCESNDEALRIIASYLDYIFLNLTAKQAVVIKELLVGGTQWEVAKKLKRTQSTINKHANAGGWRSIIFLKTEFKKLVNKMK